MMMRCRRCGADHDVPMRPDKHRYICRCPSCEKENRFWKPGWAHNPDKALWFDGDLLDDGPPLMIF